MIYLKGKGMPRPLRNSAWQFNSLENKHFTKQSKNIISTFSQINAVESITYVDFIGNKMKRKKLLLTLLGCKKKKLNYVYSLCETGLTNKKICQVQLV